VEVTELQDPKASRLPDWWTKTDTRRWPPEAKEAFELMVRAVQSRVSPEPDAQSQKEADLRYYTVKEAAELLGLSVSTVGRLIRSGKLKAINISPMGDGGRSLRTTARWIEAFMNGGNT
jgi:excisionase family DNA binding protein